LSRCSKLWELSYGDERVLDRHGQLKNLALKIGTKLGQFEPNKLNMQLKVKILWTLFFVTILASIVNIIGDSFGLSFLQVGFFNSLILYIPVILLLLHSIWTLSFFRGILFILLACLTGFIFEYIGLKYGVVFGGDYIYSPVGIKIFTVPLNVILYWGVFIYTGYCITNSFLIWQGKNKPSKNKKTGLLLPLFILFDSLVVVAIDLFMDPLQVKQGSWTWLNGGPYFGIPVGNFIGWILVVIIATGLFRLFEYFSPKEITKGLKNTFLIPVLGYGLLYLNFLISAIKIEMIGLVLIGSFTMFPIVLLNLFLFSRSQLSKAGMVK